MCRGFASHTCSVQWVWFEGGNLAKQTVRQWQGIHLQCTKDQICEVVHPSPNSKIYAALCRPKTHQGTKAMARIAQEDTCKCFALPMSTRFSQCNSKQSLWLRFPKITERKLQFPSHSSPALASVDHEHTMTVRTHQTTHATQSVMIHTTPN